MKIEFVNSISLSDNDKDNAAKNAEVVAIICNVTLAKDADELKREFHGLELQFFCIEFKPKNMLILDDLYEIVAKVKI